MRWIFLLLPLAGFASGITNDLGIGTSVYRGPLLVTMPSGIIIAISDHRYAPGGPGGTDGDSGHIAKVCWRSSNCGTNWTSEQFILDDGANCYADCSAVVDPSINRVYVLCSWNLAADNEGTIDSNRAMKIYEVHSDDEGTNWTSRVEITSNVRSNAWAYYGMGPGHGIQLSSGRLLVPAYHNMTGTANYYANVIYSDDHGSSWHQGGSGSFLNANESCLVQLVDGKILMNSRDENGGGRRLITISSDQGDTWGTTTNDSNLIDPRVEGAIVRWTKSPAYASNRILFSNPASTSARTAVTVRLSKNECQSWAYSKQYFSGPSGYSDLCIMTNGAFGLFSENGVSWYMEKVTFISDTLASLTGGGDVLDPVQSQASLTVGTLRSAP